MPAARLVFVDESGANTQMTRRYGRSPRGQRAGSVALCRADGWRELFLAWVKQGLVPALQRDDVVVLDNLATHKVAGAREAIAGAGARLEYLPPYSPDFNPIAPMWSKVKQELKSQEPRTARQLF